MFPVLELSGSAFERGRQYGLKARDRIARSIETYRRLFACCGLAWGEAQAISARYARAIRELDPSLYQEIEGIAAGSGRESAEILALNCRSEILPPRFPEPADPAWIEAMKRQVDPGECTAIAVEPRRSASGGALLAQNWDWLGEQRGALVILRVRTAHATFLTLTEAGMLAKIGLNGRGLGVCLNILRSRTDGLGAGVPVHLLLRRLLECARVADAAALVLRLRYGASSNILCADRAGAVASFELSPAGAALVPGAEGVLCHTNHFLDPALAKGEAPPAGSLSSQPRLERARALAAARSKLGVEDLQRLLRDGHGGALAICRGPDPGQPWQARVETVASVVMELDRGVMHVAPDLPSRCAYVPVALAAHAAVS